MASPFAAIVEAQFVNTSASTLYTSPAGTTTRIDKVTCCNTSGSTATVTIYVVPSGSSASATNTTTSAQAILPGGTFNSPNEYGLYLAPGDSIAALASATLAINILIGGTQAT